MNAKVESIILYPIGINHETLGYIWATNFDIANLFTIKSTLELTTFILATEIQNHNLFDSLKTLSVTDLLTGVKNRNAMNNMISDISAGRQKLESSYGIVFIDLNGLKQINDNEGHIAGDMLLKDASRMIREVFEEHEIFRIGGDEFLVIVIGKSENEFNDLVSLLRKYSNESVAVKLAIGAVYEDPDFDIRRAMHNADELMYIDKERFYSEKKKAQG